MPGIGSDIGDTKIVREDEPENRSSGVDTNSFHHNRSEAEMDELDIPDLESNYADCADFFRYMNGTFLRKTCFSQPLQLCVLCVLCGSTSVFGFKIFRQPLR